MIKQGNQRVQTRYSRYLIEFYFYLSFSQILLAFELMVCLSYSISLLLPKRSTPNLIQLLAVLSVSSPESHLQSLALLSTARERQGIVPLVSL